VLSVDSPHNNLTQVLAETGILGFAPYLMVNVLLLKAMWQLRGSCQSGNSVWKFYFYIFLTYWITGLTESSGYSPLNLIYVFAITVCYKYAMTDPDSMHPAEIGVADEAFSVPSESFSPRFSDEGTI
jgi:O-antigen ligase